MNPAVNPNSSTVPAGNPLVDAQFSSEYIYLDYCKPVSNGEGKRYKRTENLPDISYAKFIELLPDFLEYAMSRLQEEDRLGDWPDVKEQFIPKLTQFFAEEFDFKDSTILTSNGLASFLFRISEWGDLELEKNGYPGGSGVPLEKAYRRIFTGKPEGQSEFPYGLVYDLFNKYLLKEYFFKPAPDESEQEADQRFRLSQELAQTTQILVSLSTAPSLSNQISVLLLHNAMNLITEFSELKIPQILIFNAQIEAIFDNPQKIELEPEQAASAFLKVLQDYLPEIYISEVSEEKYKIAIIKSDKAAKGSKQSEQICEVVSVDNFYCHPLEEVPASHIDYARLPKNGQILHRSEIFGKDVSLFDPCGNKVYWGDLSEQDISNLQGPLYMLSSADSYHQVPKWVVKLKRPAMDKNRPVRNFMSKIGMNFKDDSIILRADYIRLKARGMIKDGKYIENFRNI